MMRLFDFKSLYSNFSLPISDADCGGYCAPYNERGIPFCCDIQQAVPTAYVSEWDYLQQNTNLWHLYLDESPDIAEDLISKVPDCQLLLACRGAAYCEREFRALSCRSFPFYPYIARSGEFVGLSYFWEFEDRCWVVSNLGSVSMDFHTQFIKTYEKIFELMPEEKERYRGFSSIMRQVFGRKHRVIPVLHRNGSWYKITPRNGRLRRISAQRLPKFSYYKIAEMLPFPDEITDQE